jgi:hypothetical protein
MVDQDRSQLTIQYRACAMDTGYRHILRICNTYCFSTAIVVTRTHHNVKSYVHCLPCVECMWSQGSHICFESEDMFWDPARQVAVGSQGLLVASRGHFLEKGFVSVASRAV